jgi:hypothetical protein
MGKRAKEHRKKVAARNQRIKQAQTAFKNKFQEELLRQIELEKQKQKAVEGEVQNTVTPEEENQE